MALQPLCVGALLFITAVLVCSTSCSAGYTYCVSPSCPRLADSACPDKFTSCHNEQCLTLTEIVSNTTHFLQSNTTLVLLPGDHSLTGEVVSVSNARNLALTGCGEDTDFRSRVSCSDSSFTFSDLTNLQLTSIEFVSCKLTLLAVSGTFMNTKFNGSCEHQGGALAIYNESDVQFVGNNKFVHNKARIAGGAVFSDGSVISFSDNTTFDDNHAGVMGGGAIFLTNNSQATFSGLTMFARNNVTEDSWCNDQGCGHPSKDTYGGGAVLALNSTMAFEGETMFLDNAEGFKFTETKSGDTASIGGGGMYLVDSSVTFTGTTKLSGNVATGCGGGLYVSTCHLTFSGRTDFILNRAGDTLCGGGLYTNWSNTSFTGSTAFVDNTAYRGNGLYASSFNNVDFTGNSFFTSASQAYNGGAGYLLKKNSLVFQGNSTFENHSVSQLGGVFYVLRYNELKFDGHSQFLHNSAVRGGAIRFSTHNNISFNGVTQFENNSASYKGGALDLDHDINIVFDGNSTFSNNMATNGGALATLDRNYINFAGNQTFSHNSADLGGAICSRVGSVYNITGTSTFTNNTARIGAGIYMSEVGLLTISATVLFYGNNAFFMGGGMAILYSQANLTGFSEFTDNGAKHGAGIYAENSEIVLKGHGMFTGNSVIDSGSGGAIHISNTNLMLENEWNIINNTANVGGGIAIAGLGNSVLNLHPNTTLVFKNNTAQKQGGAMYVEANPTTYCEFINGTQAPEPCFLQQVPYRCQPQFIRYNYSMGFEDIHFDFVNNSAVETGNVIHGGSLYTCQYCIGTESYIHGYDAFKSITSSSSQDLDISCDPFRVVTCENHSNNSTWRVYPNQVTSVSVIAVGQMNAVSPANIHAITSEGITLEPSQILQSVTNNCTDLNYTVSSVDFQHFTSGTLKLYANDPCSVSGFPFTANITFLPCPLGFFLHRNKCQCDRRLQGFNIECNIQDQTFVRMDDFWIGVTDSDSQLIVHPHCPFDYCKSSKETVRFPLNNSDLQCANRRSGVVCGQCQSGLSLTLGSSHCMSCSNLFLLLIIPFGLAGIVLVVLLFILQIHVSTGALSGLVFYANILAVNQNVFIPPGETNFLTVFLAWLNLDLGIKTCFADGLDAYTSAWLQFLFPVYIWLLVGLVTWLARVSLTVSKVIGKTNPVSVLATLFLLSYTKLLRTIIAALSATNLEYPHDRTKLVWLYDGNVEYLGNQHAYLFVFSLSVFLFLFLPYSLLLLFGQWILSFQMNWLSRRNYLRLKIFLDAHYAPFRKEHRYWFGLLLFVRALILLVSAIIDMRHPQDPHTNLLVMLVLVAGLQMWAWIVHGVYQELYIDILEASFMFNLVVFIGGTYQISLSGGNQTALVYSSVGVAFATFLAIMAFFVWKNRVTRYIWNNITARLPARSVIETVHGNIVQSEEVEAEHPVPNILGNTITQTRVHMSSNSLREPLLETVSY